MIRGRPRITAELHRRDITANHKRVGRVMGLVTGQGRLFLATVIDPHNREVVGHALGPDPTTDLVIEAIEHNPITRCRDQPHAAMR